MPAFVTAPVDGVTEAEATERARIAKLADANTTVRKAPGSSASLSIQSSDPHALARQFAPGEPVRVVLHGHAKSTTVRPGTADVTLEVHRVGVRPHRTISDMIAEKQKGL